MEKNLKIPLSLAISVLICAALLNIQLVKSETRFCFFKTVSKTVTVQFEGVNYTFVANKTTFEYLNGTTVIFTAVSTSIPTSGAPFIIRANLTKTISPQQPQQKAYGNLVRDWEDGIWFIYDCPLNSIYYPHPDHYFTYPDEDHLMNWNLPWSINGTSKQHIHISQDEISEMKTKNTISVGSIIKALVSGFGSVVVAGKVVPFLVGIFKLIMGSSILGGIVGIVVGIIICAIIYLFVSSIPEPTVSDWVQQDVELYHHDGFVWLWDPIRKYWGTWMEPENPNPDNCHQFFIPYQYHTLEFKAAWGKELSRGETNHISVDVYMPLGWGFVDYCITFR